MVWLPSAGSCWWVPSQWHCEKILAHHKLTRTMVSWLAIPFLLLPTCIHGNRFFWSSVDVQTLGTLSSPTINLSQPAIRLQPYPQFQRFSVRNVWQIWTSFWISFFFHGVFSQRLRRVDECSSDAMAYSQCKVNWSNHQPLGAIQLVEATGQLD